MSDVSFPRLYARTQRFTLGRPRNIRVGEDTILFLRARAGDDPTHDLWRLDLADGGEQRLTDAASLHAGGGMTAAERARRERLREGGHGVVAYAADRGLERACFALDGTAWLVAVGTGEVWSVEADGAVFDPRLSPDGQQLAAVIGDQLHVGPSDGALRPLCAEDGVRWGQADFIAAEEMQRTRGFWWSPDGTRLLVCRVDDRRVPVVHLGDPANPTVEPVQHRYPAAGTTNPDVSLWLVDVADDRRTEVVWDRETHPYLAQVRWGSEGPPLLQVQRRDQREEQILSVDDDGGTAALRTHTDPQWLDIVAGSPRWFEGALVVVGDVHDHGPGGSRALVVDGAVVTPPGMQVRGIAGQRDDELWFTFSEADPTVVHVGSLNGAGGLTRHTSEPGLHGVSVGPGAVVVSSTTLDEPRPRHEVWTSEDHDLDHGVFEIESLQLQSPIDPQVRLLELGSRSLASALLVPDGDGLCPVLLMPYGGPHAQRVLQSSTAFLTAQWFADHGFAVLVADGRGTPGRGPLFEREVAGDLAGPVLEDQIDALQAAAGIEPRLDLRRVGISGWSFGGYLAALAVLRRPDVFRAGIAGAPVTQWGLYDTHYTERYLGRPDEAPDAYQRSDLVGADGELLGAADVDAEAAGELLIIHGLADDNVVAAHALRLSSALLAAGRPHEFLPLVGVTHMTPQEVVAENLLLHQLRFLRRCLAV